MNDYKFWDELGNIFNAVLAYQQKTIEFNKRFVTPWIQMGGVFDPQDDHVKAVTARKQAIEIDPQCAGNFVALGDEYFKMNQFDAAADAYSRAIELDPRAGWAHANLALIHASRENVVKAIELYRRSLELIADSKDRAMVWNRLGNAYRKMNDYANAILAFQQADECDADNTGFTDRLDEESINVKVVEDDRVAILPSEMPAESDVIAPENLVETVTETNEAQPVVAEPEAEMNTVVTQPEKAVERTAFEQTAVEEAMTGEREAEVVAEQAVEQGAATEVSTEVVEEFPTDEAVADNAFAESAVEEDSAVEEQSRMEETPVTIVNVDAEPVETAEAVVESEGDVLMEEAGAEQVDEMHIFESTTETTITPVPMHDAESIAASMTVDETEVVVVNQIGSLAVEAAESGIVPELAAEAPVAAAQTEAVEPVAEERVQSAAAEASDEDSNETIIQAIISLVENNGANTDNDLPDFLKEEAQGPISAKPMPEVKIQIEPDTQNAHIWNELGNVYFDTGAYEEAIAAYTKSIELDVRFAWPYSNLALAYVQKEKYDEAVLLYQRSIELFQADKDKAITFNRLGNVYRRINDYDNAIASYQRADELDPNNATRSLRSRFSLLGSMNLELSQNLAI
jgi:tetratricopeptide (TPR) repeat protein